MKTHKSEESKPVSSATRAHSLLRASWMMIVTQRCLLIPERLVPFLSTTPLSAYQLADDAKGDLRQKLIEC